MKKVTVTFFAIIIVLVNVFIFTTDAKADVATPYEYKLSIKNNYNCSNGDYTAGCYQPGNECDYSPPTCYDYPN